MNPKIRILLRLCLLSLIIISLKSGLFAQGQEEIRDPFLSLNDKLKLAQKPLDITRLPYPVTVNGIIWTENLQLAVINDETVEKNQQWRDFKVEEIDKEKVILSLGKNRFEIPVITEKKEGQVKDEEKNN